MPGLAVDSSAERISPLRNGSVAAVAAPYAARANYRIKIVFFIVTMLRFQERFVINQQYKPDFGKIKRLAPLSG